MSDERRGVKHTLTIEKREQVSVTGVMEVISFDEEAIVAETEMGILIIRGMNLHVNKLNLEAGELAVDGDIINVSYEDQAAFGKGKSILSKLFK